MNNHVNLRPLRVADAAEMTRVLSSPNLYVFTGGMPPNEDELERRYTAQTRGVSADGSQQWLNFIVTLQPANDAIGYVQATIPQNYEPTEIAWVIGEPWQQRGYARAAVELLISELKRLSITNVVAHIHPEHVASQRLAEHLGMSPTNVIIDNEVEWRGSLNHRSSIGKMP